MLSENVFISQLNKADDLPLLVLPNTLILLLEGYTWNQRQPRLSHKKSD